MEQQVQKKKLSAKHKMRLADVCLNLSEELENLYIYADVDKDLADQFINVSDKLSTLFAYLIDSLHATSVLQFTKDLSHEE